jgi:hypothetical protein
MAKTYHLPYKCPKGGNHKFDKRKEVTVRIFFKRVTRTVLICSKCGRLAGKFRLPPG